MGDRNQNVFVVFTKTLNLFIWSIVYLLGTQPEQWLYHQHILWLRCNHVGKVGGCNLPTDTFSVHKCIRCYQDRHFQGSLLSNFSGQILRGDHKRYVLEKPTHACLLLPSTLLSFPQKNVVIWLCWGYRFWFFLIFLVLQVHELGTFMPNSSVFISLMLRPL